MRSDLVFGAMKHVPNRYLLTLLASKAARKLHRPGTRMQDTANSVLARCSFSNPLRQKHATPISLLCEYLKPDRALTHPKATMKGRTPPDGRCWGASCVDRSQAWYSHLDCRGIQ
jgi:hypothetical protein